MLAYDHGLIQSELREWLKFRDARNTTSHVYAERKADAVFMLIPSFLSDATYLLTQLQQRTGGDS